MQSMLIGGQYHGKIVDHDDMDEIWMAPKPMVPCRLGDDEILPTYMERDLLVYTKRRLTRHGEVLVAFAITDMTDEQVVGAITNKASVNSADLPDDIRNDHSGFAYVVNTRPRSEEEVALINAGQIDELMRIRIESWRNMKAQAD